MLRVPTSSASSTQIERQIETDLRQHLEDTPLFWIIRSNRSVQRTWNELTETERQQTQEAQVRAQYIALFNPCNW